ncbi:MAG: hypothetical protein GXY11_07345, partial [Clostridiales bacterium]|nr:hypothetical protein [Clostridiales bacterium]
VRVVLSTYKGLPQNSSTFIGSVEKTFTMTLSDDAYPSIGSMGTTRVANGVPAAITRHVQNKTKCYVAILDAQGAYGSTITNYTVTGNGQTFNNSSGTFGVFPTAGTVTFTGTVKDSRGRTRTSTISITVDPYSAPSLTKIQAYRSISDGTANTSGTYLSLKATTLFSSLGGQNAVTLRGRFAQRGGSYGAWNAMTSNTLKILPGLLAVYSYTAQINVVDTLGSSYTYTATIPTDSVSFNLMDGGMGAAFGKYAENANYLELAAGWGLMFGVGSIMRGPNLRYASRLLNTSPDENLNDIAEEWVVSRSTSVNNPNASNFFYIHTVSLSSSRMQVAYGYNATNLAYYRSLYNSTWTAWRSI